MTAKEYLSAVYRLHVLIEQRRSEREALKAFDGITGVDYSQDRVQASHSHDAPFARTVEKLVLLDAELSRMLEDYTAAKHKIIGEIQSLDNPVYMNILYKRYVEFKSFEAAAVEMHYSYGHVIRLHKLALGAFGRRFLKR